MKFIARVVVCAFLVLPVILSCAGGPKSENEGAAAYREGEKINNGKSFSDAEGKEWFLSEFRNGGKTVLIPENGSSGKIYSIIFEGDRASGVGAINRFFGPCTVGAGGTLSIGNLASTMMAPLREPENLKEHEYFTFLSGVTRWELHNGKLELYSKNSEGAETVLVFVQN
jgi:heat shock protein HslJ